MKFLAIFLSLAAQALAAPPTDEAYHWRNVEIGAGGFVPGIIFHPGEKGLVYCRTDIGGAYKLNVASGRWEPLTDIFTNDEWNLLGIDAIGLDPNDPQKLYLVCGAYLREWAALAAILRSGDQGKTWERSYLPFQMGGNQDGRSMGERLVVDPSNGQRLLLGTRRDGIWESLDGAKTWAQVEGFPYKGATPNDGGIGFITFVTPQLLFAGVADNDKGLYRSADGGKSWDLVEKRPEGLMPHHGYLAADKKTLYFTFADGPGPNGMSKGAVWKLDSSSGDWTEITPKDDPALSYGFAGLALDASNADVLMVASMDRWKPGDEIWRSIDGGKSWKAVGPKAKRDLSATPYMYWGRPRSQKPGSGNWNGSMVMDPFNPDRVLYGTGATIMESLNVRQIDKNGVSNWHVQGMGVEETAVLDLESPPEGARLISGIGDIGGFTHDDLSTSPSKGMTLPVYTTVTSLDFAQKAPKVMARCSRGHHATDDIQAGYSVDGGVTWKNFPASPAKGKHAGDLAVGADGKTIVWAPDRSEAHFTRDLGKTWVKCGGLPAGAVVVADRENPLKFYCLHKDTLYASDDGGQSFVKANESMERGKIEAVPGRDGELWLASDKGLFRALDSGRKWLRVAGADKADALGFGKPAPGKSYPAMYISGMVRGRMGLYRSDDGGTWWVGINNAKQQWGWTGQRVIGDPRQYGRVYVATNGRGIQMGDPAKP